MQAAELIKYIKDPASLNKQSTADLQKLVNDFPYFQTAHLLLSMSSKKWDASVYQQSLKKTAIVATNRAHLFSLIHQLENNLTVEKEEKVVEEKITDQKNIIEDQKHELDILKATDVITETKKEEVLVSTKKVLDPEEVLEKEIQKNVVESFVEKEILKTQELHRPIEIKKEEPANFSDWLLFLRKNNGQSYENIEEKVNEQKEKNKTSTKRKKIRR